MGPRPVSPYRLTPSAIAIWTPIKRSSSPSKITMCISPPFGGAFAPYEEDAALDGPVTAKRMAAAHVSRVVDRSHEPPVAPAAQPDRRAWPGVAPPGAVRIADSPGAPAVDVQPVFTDPARIPRRPPAEAKRSPVAR